MVLKEDIQKLGKKYNISGSVLDILNKLKTRLNGKSTKINLENTTSFNQIFVKTSYNTTRKVYETDKTPPFLILTLIGEKHLTTNICLPPKISLCNYVGNRLLDNPKAYVFLECHHSFLMNNKCLQIGSIPVQKLGILCEDLNYRAFGWDLRPEWFYRNEDIKSYLFDDKVNSVTNKNREYYSRIKNVLINKFFDIKRNYLSEINILYRNTIYYDFLIGFLEEINELFKIGIIMFNNIKTDEEKFRLFMRNAWANLVELNILLRALAIPRDGYNEVIVIAGDEHIKNIIKILEKYNNLFDIKIRNTKGENTSDCAYFLQ